MQKNFLTRDVLTPCVLANSMTAIFTSFFEWARIPDLVLHFRLHGLFPGMHAVIISNSTVPSHRKSLRSFVIPSSITKLRILHIIS